MALWVTAGGMGFVECGRKTLKGLFIHTLKNFSGCFCIEFIARNHDPVLSSSTWETEVKVNSLRLVMAIL